MRKAVYRFIISLALVLVALSSVEGSSVRSMTAVLQTIPVAEVNPYGHSVFVQGEPVTIGLAVMTSGGKLQQPVSEYKVVDFWSRTVEQGSVTPKMMGSMGRITLSPATMLEPGWYRLELGLRDASGQITTTYRPGTDKTLDHEPFVTFAILPTRQVAENRQTPFAIDAAMSWLVGTDQFKALADLMRLSGVSWARDRMSWSEVEASRGQLEWGKYARSADAQHEADINVLQVYHDAPAWSRSEFLHRLPDDLFAVYRYAQEAAQKFAGKVQAWEFWNEHDHVFNREPGDHYAAAFKAASLGFKEAGGTRVALGPLAFAPGPYIDLVMQNDVLPYMDIYTFHTYADATTAAYDRFLAEHFRFLEKWHIEDQEVWITESGRHFLKSSSASFMAAAEAQVQYLVQSYTKALAAGIDRFFWFVLPHFMRPGSMGGGQTGILRGDLTPHPAYVTLATLTNVLGDGRYVGAAQKDNVTVHVFHSGTGTPAVVWADGKPATIRIPAECGIPQVINVMGQTTTPSLIDNAYNIEVGAWPIFITGLDWSRDIAQRNDDVAAKQAKLATQKDIVSPVVLFNRWDPKLMNGDGKEGPLLGYSLPVGGTELTVEIYNFGKEQWRGAIRPETPPGFSFTPEVVTVDVAPMSKASIVLQLTVPKVIQESEYLITINGISEDGKVETKAVSRLIADLSMQGQPVPITKVMPRALPSWTTYISPQGTTRVRQTQEERSRGTAGFEHRFAGSGDRWTYPFLQLPEPMDLHDYIGVRFQIVGDVTGEATCQFSVLDADNHRYFPQQPYKLGKGKQDLTFLFSDLYQPNWIQDRGPLDLSRIQRVYFGCNTTNDLVTYQISSIDFLQSTRIVA